MFVCMPVVLNMSGHASMCLAVGGGGATPDMPCGRISNICGFFQGEPGFLGPQGEPGLPGLPGTKVGDFSSQLQFLQ